jgi:4-azaleucine resistance transporter AzlC
MVSTPTASAFPGGYQLMALTIYGGSVEFVIANMLTQAFNPLTVLVITLVVGFRQFFYSIAMLGKYKGARFPKVLSDFFFNR